jgi:hypothetical protein
LATDKTTPNTVVIYSGTNVINAVIYYGIITTMAPVATFIPNKTRVFFE